MLVSFILLHKFVDSYFCRGNIDEVQTRAKI